MSVALHAEGVTKGFGSRSAPVLRGVSIALEPGHVTLVRGAPGAGKSTLLRCLAGTYRLDGGRVWLRDRDEQHAVDAADARAVVWLRWHHLGLADGMLVCAPREPAAGAVARALERAGSDPAAAREAAAAVLAGLGLENLAQTPVGLLAPRASRAVAIARALVRPPAVLLLDEPTQGLDARGSRYVIGLVRAAREAGTAVLATAGDVDPADDLADAVLHMREGRLTAPEPAASATGPDGAEAPARVRGAGSREAGGLLHGVTLVAGDGSPPVQDAIVRLDGDGIVTAIQPGAAQGRLVLMPPAVDLHLDVIPERRRPRASVVLDLAQTVVTLDAELTAAGIGTVCIAARFEDEPAKGVHLRDALALCEVVDDLNRSLVCDWRVHARVEVTESDAPGALESALARVDSIALVSVMDHSAEHSRFASYEAHREFYAADWGLSLDDVETILARKRAGAAGAPERRAHIARLATSRGIALASHDDRAADDVRGAHALGATVAEFPLTVEAARTARALGLRTVLGAPNAVRGRSTSPGNLTVAEAVALGVCDVLCSDYLPSALLAAPFALADRGALTLAAAVAMTTTAPAEVVGVASPPIAVGRPLDAIAVARAGSSSQAVARWRDGRIVHLRHLAAGRSR